MKYDFKKIIETVDELKKSDNLIDETLTKFCQALNQSVYPVFSEHSELSGFLKALEIVNDEIGAWLSYYVYEVSERAYTVKCEHGIYDFRDRQQVISFLDKEVNKL